MPAKIAQYLTRYAESLNAAIAAGHNVRLVCDWGNEQDRRVVSATAWPGYVEVETATGQLVNITQNHYRVIW